MNSRLIVLTLIGILLGRALDCCAQQNDKKPAIQQAVDLILSRQDKNGDGKVSKQEAGPGLQRAFGRYDANRDGDLDRKELAELAKSFSGRVAIPPPTHRDVRYGDHHRNVLDFWQASADKPAPLVLFFHGGGFNRGSKIQVYQRSQEVKKLLDANISVASIGYRHVEDAKEFSASFYDCRRALQFLRSKADEWKIDPSRVGAFGSSRGAVNCMYLAFHDEMSDPSSPDPISRESTRLSCIAVAAAQTTNDYQWWVDNIPGMPPADAKAGKFFRESGLTKKDYFHSRFGVTTREEFLKKQGEFSAQSLISKDDPPIFLQYQMAPDSKPPNSEAAAESWRSHHVIMGVKLKEKMDALGVEAHLQYPGRPTLYDSQAAFLIEKLNVQRK